MPWHTSTPMDQKTEFVLKAIHSDNFRRLCRDYGISAKTGYKWKERFLEQGLAGLQEESRRPQSHSEELGEQVVCRIVLLKQRHPHWGPAKIHEIYAREHGGSQTPSLSSFKRVLERAGLVQKRRTRRVPEMGAVRLHSGRRAQAPNEVWSVDFKGWWHDPEGRRCEPLTVRDEHSRYLLECQRMSSARTEAVWERFERLFERHGLPQAIRSDNGPPFATRGGVLGLSKLSARWVALGIELERSRPGCPQDNGAHERMHRDMSIELQHSAEGWSQGALDAWREQFNHQRPHQALGMKLPAEVYANSTQRYRGLPEDLEYAQCLESRLISSSGTVKWEQQSIFISRAIAGWSVGLRPSSEGLIDVYFANLQLGQIEPSTSSFLRAASRPQEAADLSDIL
ncbi:integrase core domain-containing protein, partial [Brevifollis gellanilyticus]|uniref:integrase core domain-containing protein n=1 Tax=Brevifollis gellanilyticus TaxID=748831 RepID=UPI0011BD9D12